jgi:hypothetical protein
MNALLIKTQQLACESRQAVLRYCVVLSFASQKVGLGRKMQSGIGRFRSLKRGLTSIA